MSGEFHVRTLK